MRLVASSRSFYITISSAQFLLLLFPFFSLGASLVPPSIVSFFQNSAVSRAGCVWHTYLLLPPRQSSSMDHMIDHYHTHSLHLSCFLPPHGLKSWRYHTDLLSLTDGFHCCPCSHTIICSLSPMDLIAAHGHISSFVFLLYFSLKSRLLHHSLRITSL